jgi:uncharacterized protein YdaU (DUF1376 family)
MKSKRIKYVSLESGAFISDLVFQVMTAEERGVYCTLLFYLYENDGRLPFDIESLKSLCNCTDFEKVWEFIKQKFTVKNGKISHKRVARELNKARQLSQTQSQKGVKGMKSRWSNDNTAITQQLPSNNQAITKRREANRSEDKISNNTNSNTSQFNSIVSSPRLATTLVTASASGGTPLELGVIEFYDKLTSIFTGRTVSDTTSLRNLARWVKDSIAAGRFNNQVMPRILDMAVDSKTGNSRKPIAVFFARVKKELGYTPNTYSHNSSK